jgi:hypothetical protein
MAVALVASGCGGGAASRPSNATQLTDACSLVDDATVASMFGVTGVHGQAQGPAERYGATTYSCEWRQGTAFMLTVSTALLTGPTNAEDALRLAIGIPPGVPLGSDNSELVTGVGDAAMYVPDKVFGGLTAVKRAGTQWREFDFTGHYTPSDTREMTGLPKDKVVPLVKGAMAKV